MALLLPACVATEPEDALPSDLAGTDWIAKTVAGRKVPDDVAVTLQFAASDRIAGRSGCNRFTGPIGVVNGQLEVGPLAATRMACPPSQMALESAFLAALSQAKRITRDNSALVLHSSGGIEPSRLLPFTPP